jgi:FkbM family methyltransferase
MSVKSEIGKGYRKLTSAWRARKNADLVAIPPSPFWHFTSSFDAIATIKRHAAGGQQLKQGFVTNFLGVRTATKFFPGILDDKSGTIEPVPIPANWHADIAEWGSALRAVEMSGASFTILELGCGWGCWLNNTGAAARRMGKKVKLFGIEGDRHHVNFAHEALQENGFGDDEYTIIHGVAASANGMALFPIVSTPGASWGSAPILNASKKQIAEAQSAGGYMTIEAFSIESITAGEILDLVHIDIQGGEEQLIRDSIENINHYVRHLLVGTHSRAIEAGILNTMLDNGWLLELERPAINNIVDGKPVIAVDGVLFFKNARNL